ncbi:MAG TPA: hypothetical protein VEB64_10715, partial [Azospirillaceae bacterium]|nr:hypothetical protein [Azospirillaceae bacterium]
PPEPATLDDCADRIKSLWADAQQRLLDIGELLDWAERQFKAGGQFIAWIDASLPFKRGAAYQILKAARALRSGIVPHEVAPAGYTAVYLASTLTPEERQLALDKGVIRPDMRRQDLVAFKRSLRALPQATDERATLEAEEKRLLAKLAEVRARIAALA